MLTPEYEDDCAGIADDEGARLRHVLGGEFVVFRDAIDSVLVCPDGLIKAPAPALDRHALIEALRLGRGKAAFRQADTGSPIILNNVLDDDGAFIRRLRPF